MNTAVQQAQADLTRTVWSGAPRFEHPWWWRKWVLLALFLAQTVAGWRFMDSHRRLVSFTGTLTLFALAYLLYLPATRFIWLRARWTRRARRQGRVLMRGHVRALRARPDGVPAAVFARTQIKGFPDAAHAKQVEVYVQEAFDFDLVTAEGRAIRVHAADAHLIVPPPEQDAPLACVDAPPAVIDELSAQASAALAAPLAVATVCRQTITEGTYVEIFGTLRPAVDRAALEVLPRDLPLGQELAPAPEGLLIFPYSPFREEWLYVPDRREWRMPPRSPRTRARRRAE
jgi:hypothetical protein